jgi:WD40 repeat protein
MRPGYETYAQLLHRLTHSRHQSCVLLTSREQPHGLERFEEDTSRVRLLRLDGLDSIAGQAILAARGLVGTDDEVATLVRRYSGNPLALRLVAQTVREVFDGDLHTFLAAEAPIFGDISAVLDQQIARLSPIEHELLTWLAIEREPTSVLALRANLVSPGPPRAAVEALHALLRRSLVVQSGGGLALPNVITEYLTDALLAQVVREICGELPPGTPAADEPAAALNRFALCKARAKDYVRASQARLILEPVAARALERLGRDALIQRLLAIVAGIRARGERTPGYAAGTILNLLLHLGTDLRRADFSGLCVWQASLQGALLPGVDFAGSDLAGSSFSRPLQNIHNVQFGTDGHLHIAGTTARRICLWHIVEGQLREERTFGEDASAVLFGPDRRLLISWHADRHIRLWDIERGSLIHTLSGSDSLPWRTVLSLDGGTLASAYVGGEVLVWDVTSGVLRHTLRGHSAAVPALAISADGRMLASGDVNGTICLWRLDPPELVRTLHGHSQEVHVLAFDPTNDAILASGSHDRTVRLWDVASGQVLRTLRAHSEMIRVMAFSPDGRTLASGGGDTFVCLWDVATGEVQHALPDLQQRCLFLAFDADSRLLATVGSDQSIGLWSVESGRRLETIVTHSDEVIALDVSPDGSQVISGGTSGVPHIWDVGDGRTGVRALLGHTDRVQAVGWSPHGELLASAGCDRAIHLWDAGTGRLTRKLHGHSNDVQDLHFSRDGRLISCSRDTTVRLWDVQSGELLQLFRGHTEDVLCCALSRDGRLAASGGSDRDIRLWDTGVHGGGTPRVFSGHTAAVLSVAFSPDGRWLLSSGFDQQVLVWDVGDGRLRGAFSTPGTVSTAIAMHPNSELLATGDEDNAVRLWRLVPAVRRQELRSVEESGVVQLCAELRGHTRIVAMVRFSPDGLRLYSTSMDETIRVWDVATGTCLRVLRAEGPYAGMNIAGVTGISDAQKAALKTLGAVDETSLASTPGQEIGPASAPSI